MLFDEVSRIVAMIIYIKVNSFLQFIKGFFEVFFEKIFCCLGNHMR